MDLSRDDDGGATQDRSNAPITTTNDPEQVGCGKYVLLSASSRQLLRIKIRCCNYCFIDDVSGTKTGLLSGQRDQVLLFLQEENAEEKDREVEMTARLRQDSEISKSRRRRGRGRGGGAGRGGQPRPQPRLRGTQTFKK